MTMRAACATLAVLLTTVFIGTVVYGIREYWHVDWPTGWFLPVLFGTPIGAALAAVLAIVGDE